MCTPHLLDKNIERLISLYRTDMSLAQIAKQLHVSQTTLKSKIKELGLTRTPRHKKKPIDIQLFKELVKRGISDVQIARKLRICTDTVLKIKKKYSIASLDERRVFYGKKGAVRRREYKQNGLQAECIHKTNILEQYKDEVIPLLEKGTSRTDVAKRYGVCRATVHNFINLYGVKAPIKKICDGKEQMIQAAFKAGASLDDISGVLNCHMQTVYHQVKEMKLTRSQKTIKRKSLLNNQEELIKELYYQGMSGTQIAEKVGVSYPNVYKFINRKQFDTSKRHVEYSSTFNGYDSKLIQMRQKGMTLKQIGDQFGVRANTVLYRLKKLTMINERY